MIFTAKIQTVKVLLCFGSKLETVPVCTVIALCVLLVFAARAAGCRSSFHRGRAGNRQQLAGVHALVDAQLAAVLQHAYRYSGNVARIVQARVRAALVLQAQLLQHGAQLCLGARDLWEENLFVFFCLMSHCIKDNYKI